MPRPASVVGRGVLRSADGTGRPRSEVVVPTASVARFVEHFWTVAWDVDGPARRQVLGHPVIHVVVETGDGPVHGFTPPVALVHGVVRRTFHVDLPPTGWVVGARFRPGGFRAVTGVDAADLTDRVVPLGHIVGTEAAEGLLSAVLTADPCDRFGAMDAWLAARVPDSVDAEYRRALTIVTAMSDDRSLTRAEDVAAANGVSMRTLQRVLRRNVGVGPKWLLARYRLHDAVAAIDTIDDEDRTSPGRSDSRIDLAGLAASLGWFDQAHFTRDFTSHVGVSPQVYRARPR